MRSSSWLLAAACAAILALPSAAAAQQAAAGFALERLTPAAPGAGWFTQDDLGMRGPLGGALAMSGGLALDPLRVGSGDQRLSVVSREAFVELAAAATYGPWRAWLALDAPVNLAGSNGTSGGYQFTAPSLTLGNHPDTLGDARLGLAVRLLGAPGRPFRFGVAGELLVPNGDRADYISDGTFRGVLRALTAGDRGWLQYAGSVGVHFRWREQSAPGGPDGSELLFGLAGGARIDPAAMPSVRVVVGPELFGETAFRSAFAWDRTGLEGMLTARVKWKRPTRSCQVKLGAGGGIDPNFGAPVFRVALSLEVEGGS